MAIARTTTQLIASVRRRTFIKSDDPDFTDADILEMLNEQIGSYLCDLIRPYVANYALRQEDTLLVANQSDYSIPVRALNGTTEAIGIVDPTGVVPGYRLVYYDPQDAILLQTMQNSTVPVAYNMPGNVIRLYPTPGSLIGTTPTTTLRVQYFQRPSELVDPAAVGVVSSVADGSPAYSVVLASDAPATFVTGAEVEFVSAQPGYGVLGSVGVIASASGPNVTVTGTLPTAPYVPQAGDYLCLKDQAPVCTFIPLEFQECLLQWVAIKMLEAKGDQQGMDRLGKVLSASEAALRHQLPKRSMGQRRYLSAWAGLRGVPVRGLLWPLSNPGP